LLLLIFSLGFFVCAISIIRILQYANRLNTTDTTWTGVGTACWCLVEIHCGVLVSCLPTLRPLFRKAFPWLGRSDSTGSASQGANGRSDTHPATISSRRQRGNNTAWEAEHRASFGSDEALKGGAGVEMTAWAEGKLEAASVAGGNESADETQAVEGHETLSKPLQIYVRQTIVSKELRVN